MSPHIFIKSCLFKEPSAVEIICVRRKLSYEYADEITSFVVGTRKLSTAVLLLYCTVIVVPV